MTTVEERTAFAKLEALKEIRYVSYSFPYKNIDYVNITNDIHKTETQIDFNLNFRGKTISLEKMRMRLLHDLESYEGEDKCLSEYRKELELLQQEKMAHVEELRQIHSDINAVS